MGCGAYKVVFEENRDKPLDFNLEVIPLPSSTITSILNLSDTTLINELYQNASILINIIDDLRETIVDKLDELIYHSGACIFVNPDIVTCIRCIFWKISADNSGNIRKADIKFFEDDPFLEVKGKYISKSTTHIINLLINYVTSIHGLRIQMKHVDQQIPKLLYIVTENNDNCIFGKKIYNTDPSSNNDADDQLMEEQNTTLYSKESQNFINKIKTIIKRNNKKIQKAVNLFQDLVSIVNLNMEKVKYEFVLFKMSLEHIIQIDKVGVIAYEKDIDDIYEIAYLSKILIENQNGDDFEVKIIPDDVYHKSASYGKKKYADILETKKYIKEKRAIRKLNI